MSCFYDLLLSLSPDTMANIRIVFLFFFLYHFFYSLFYLVVQGLFSYEHTNSVALGFAYSILALVYRHIQLLYVKQGKCL